MKLFIAGFAAIAFLVTSCNNSKESDKKKETKTETGTGSETIVAGSDKEQVQEILDAYREATIAEDLDKMLEYISPELLRSTTKQALKEELRNGMHNEMYDLKITGIDFTELTDVVENNGDKFARAKTTTAALFKINDDEAYPTFCEQFKKKQEGVNCNDANKTITMKMDGEVYAVYSKGDEKWSILSDTDPKNVSKVIPAEVRTKLGIVLRDGDE